jgi:phosphoribosylamine--glycine ligase
VKVLVVGGGAREHALCAALRADPAVDDLWCAPGNPGIASVASCVPLEGPAAVADAADRLATDLVVVGPEAPLVAGVADAVRARGRACFGPSAAAARIEGSKEFAKSVMAAVGVPTAAATGFGLADRDAAIAHLGRCRPPYVVKYDGIAAGKGVTVTDELSVARRAVDVNLVRSGDRLLVEDYLDGPELSLFALVDGRSVLPMAPAQDFKRVGDCDTGPNTGGMGAYAPLPWLPAGAVEQVVAEILQPTVAELARRGCPFVGLLYAGLAWTADGPRVVEFNARFGDPETQSVLALLDTPLAGLLSAAAAGSLSGALLSWRPGAAVTVVLAAAGYPAAPRSGDPLTGLAAAAEVPGVAIHHAGTAMVAGELVSAGGRVLSVTAHAPSLAAARSAAYQAADLVRLPGGHLRRDIALRAVRGEVAAPAVGRSA